VSGPVIGVLGIAAMFVILFSLRIPAAFTMALVGFAGIALVTSVEAAFGIVGTEMWNIFSSYGLTVIPLFILVGEIVHYAGTTPASTTRPTSGSGISAAGSP